MGLGASAAVAMANQAANVQDPLHFGKMVNNAQNLLRK